MVRFRSSPLAGIALTLCLAGAQAREPVLPALAAESAHPAAPMVERARVTMRVDHEAGRREAEQALVVLQERPDVDLEILARITLCDYFSERDHAQARQQVERAAALLPRATRGGLRSLVLKCEGEIFEQAGDSQQALGLYERAVSAAEAASDEPSLAEALFQRGHMRGTLGDHALGLVDLKRSLALFEKNGMADHTRTVYNGIAILYNRIGDFAQAQHFYEQTLRHHEARGSLREVSVTRYNLGRTMENLGQWDAARASYQSSLETARGIGYARAESYALRGLSAVENARGNGADALRHAGDALRAQGELPDARLRAQIDMQRGIALRLLKRYDESKQVLEAALRSFTEAGARSDIAAAHDALAMTHAEAGDWRSAHDHRSRHHAVADAVLRGQLDQRFAALKVEFDTAARDKENALLLREKSATELALQQQQRAGRLQYAVIALALLSMVLLAALALRHWRTSQQMRRLAMTDELTGLPNRRDVLGRLAALIADPAAQPFAALIVDVDHFKPVNDDFGHLTGDEVLKAITAQLVETLRDPVLIGRLGGEEFLIVLPGSDLEAARLVGERLREAIAQMDTSRWLGGRTVTVSLGITLVRPGADSVSGVLRRADEALYEAKAAGRNCVRIRTEASVAVRPALAAIRGAAA